MKIHEEQVGITNIVVEYDEYAENPRHFENMTAMFCFHGRYKLGDKNPYSVSDFNNWNEMKQRIVEDFDVHTIQPLYLIDHSGISISTKSFNDPWDSGQVGWVFITNKMVNEFGMKDSDKIIQSEVDLYDKYLKGEVYSYCLIQNNEVMDSCGGFFDLDECISIAKEQIKEFDEAEEVK